MKILLKNTLNMDTLGYVGICWDTLVTLASLNDLNILVLTKLRATARLKQLFASLAD